MLLGRAGAEPDAVAADDDELRWGGGVVVVAAIAGELGGRGGCRWRRGVGGCFWLGGHADRRWRGWRAGNGMAVMLEMEDGREGEARDG